MEMELGVELELGNLTHHTLDKRVEPRPHTALLMLPYLLKMMHLTHCELLSCNLQESRDSQKF